MVGCHIEKREPDNSGESEGNCKNQEGVEMIKCELIWHSDGVAQIGNFHSRK